MCPSQLSQEEGLISGLDKKDFFIKALKGQYFDTTFKPVHYCRPDDR